MLFNRDGKNVSMWVFGNFGRRLFPIPLLAWGWHYKYSAQF